MGILEWISTEDGLTSDLDDNFTDFDPVCDGDLEFDDSDGLHLDDGGALERATSPQTGSASNGLQGSNTNMIGSPHSAFDSSFESNGGISSPESAAQMYPTPTYTPQMSHAPSLNYSHAMTDPGVMTGLSRHTQLGQPPFSMAANGILGLAGQASSLAPRPNSARMTAPATPMDTYVQTPYTNYFTQSSPYAGQTHHQVPLAWYTQSASQFQVKQECECHSVQPSIRN